jgi:hypothetical protein
LADRSFSAAAGGPGAIGARARRWGRYCPKSVNRGGERTTVENGRRLFCIRGNKHRPKTTRSRRSISYEITAPPDEDRQIVIEEARAEGWRPVSEMSGVEETPTRFRYTVSAPKGQTAKTMLVLERMENQTVVLTTLAAEDMLPRIRALQNESPALKDTVARLATIVNDINKSRSQRTQLEAERKKIVDDQNRLRQNLQSVGQGSDLGRRYLDTLKSQEDRLAEIDRLDATLESEIAAKRVAAEELARRLSL